MSTPQTGILPDASPHALYIVVDIPINAIEEGAVRTWLAQVPRITGQLAGEYPQASLSSVVAIGAGTWDALTRTPRPSQLCDFRARSLGPRKMPSTPADLLLHIRCERRDLNFELARRLMAAADGCVQVREETAGFRYLDSRDLTGFVDGTENPTGEERAEVALVGTEESKFAGGSYVMVQRYVHDLPRWRQLAISQQEHVIGRTRETDQELDDAVRPGSAHISRVVVEEDNEELAILRHSLPWGDQREAGLLFIAYSRRRDIFDIMLDRMMDCHHEGVHDALLDFTEARTGAFFFAPSLEMLAGLGK